MKNFFERNSGLWGFFGIIATILVAVIGWIFFSSSSGDKIHTTISTLDSSINNQNGTGNISITNNSSPVIVGTNNEITYAKMPTSIEEKNEKQWQECETKLRAFYRRLDRKNVSYARDLFDEHLRVDSVFESERLFKFTNERVAGDFVIENLSKGGIDDSPFVARCEFTYRLKYKDAKTTALHNELWFAVVLKDKDKVQDFQIGKLSCRDVACENSPLVNLKK